MMKDYHKSQVELTKMTPQSKKRYASIEKLSVGKHNLMKNIVISCDDDRLESGSPKVFEMESIANIFNASYDKSNMINKVTRKHKNKTQVSVEDVNNFGQIVSSLTRGT